MTTFAVLQAPLFSRTANPWVYRQPHRARRHPPWTPLADNKKRTDMVDVLHGLLEHDTP